MHRCNSCHYLGTIQIPLCTPGDATMVPVVVPVQCVDWLCFYLYGVNCSLVTVCSLSLMSASHHIGDVSSWILVY